jgi:site-specific recombinase
MGDELTPDVGIDWLIAGARADAALADRVAWLEQLVAWIRGRGRSAALDAPSPATRLRFFLQVLERHPAYRADVGRLVRETLREMDAVGLLCDTGLPRGGAFFQELAGRLSSKLFPTLPAPDDLAALFWRLFPTAQDADWVATLPATTLTGIRSLLAGEGEWAAAPFAGLARDAADALMILASHVQAIGLSHRVRQRTAQERPLDSPFAGLSAATYAYVESVRGTPEFDEAQAALRSHLARCVRSLALVTEHLENYGVSIDLVYQLERARLSLERMESLVELAALHDVDAMAAGRFTAALIRANVAHGSVRVLLGENLVLLTRRIVESARRTGEHYITRDGSEYRAMLWSAAIGGTVTGGTVTFKLLTTGHGLPPFLEGLLASTNYAVSFVLIHFLHGTLATKQPAMTAATMADHLNHARERGRLRAFVGEVAALVRSQVAAILGNLTLVVPAALLLQALLLLVGFGHLPAPQHARKYIDDLSLLGPTPLYAAFTGVLLWLSALFAGWFENWAAFKRLPEAIARSRLVVRWFGAERAASRATILENNVAALGGNVSLGVLLGMVPVIALFFGLPLEVRHVTLSTGQLALASWSHGAGILAAAPFWLAVAGIVVIGFMNLTVSFALALVVAIWSTGRGAVSRRRLARAVLAHLVTSPRDFLLPPRAT